MDRLWHFGGRPLVILASFFRDVVVLALRRPSAIVDLHVAGPKGVRAALFTLTRVCSPIKHDSGARAVARPGQGRPPSRWACSIISWPLLCKGDKLAVGV